MPAAAAAGTFGRLTTVIAVIAVVSVGLTMAASPTKTTTRSKPMHHSATRTATLMPMHHSATRTATLMPMHHSATRTATLMPMHHSATRTATLMPMHHSATRTATLMPMHHSATRTATLMPMHHTASRSSSKSVSMKVPMMRTRTMTQSLPSRTREATKSHPPTGTKSHPPTASRPLTKSVSVTPTMAPVPTATRSLSHELPPTVSRSVSASMSPTVSHWRLSVTPSGRTATPTRPLPVTPSVTRTRHVMHPRTHTTTATVTRKNPATKTVVVPPAPRTMSRTKSAAFGPFFLLHLALECNVTQTSANATAAALRAQLLDPQPSFCPTWIANPAPAPADFSSTGFTPTQVSTLLNVSLVAVLELSHATTPAVAPGCFQCTPQQIADGRAVAVVTNASLYYATTLAVAKQSFAACFGPAATTTTTGAPATTTTTTGAPATTTTTTTTGMPATSTTTQAPTTTAHPSNMTTTTAMSGAPMTSASGAPVTTSTAPPMTTIAPPPPTSGGNNGTTTSTMAPTSLPPISTTTVAPTSPPTFVPPVSTFAPDKVIQFTFEADPPAPGVPFDMGTFKTKMARFFSVNESDISPVQTGTTADGKAIIVLVFKGPDRNVLENQMGSLTAEQEQALGITAPQASPINPPTPAPPSDDLKRASSTIWIYGAAVLGVMLVGGGIFFIVRSKMSRGIASSEALDTETPMLEVPRSNNAV